MELLISVTPYVNSAYIEVVIRNNSSYISNTTISAISTTQTSCQHFNIYSYFIIRNSSIWNSFLGYPQLRHFKCTFKYFFSPNLLLRFCSCWWKWPAIMCTVMGKVDKTARQKENEWCKERLRETQTEGQRVEQSLSVQRTRTRKSIKNYAVPRKRLAAKLLCIN